VNTNRRELLAPGSPLSVVEMPFRIETVPVFTLWRNPSQLPTGKEVGLLTVGLSSLNNVTVVAEAGLELMTKMAASANVNEVVRVFMMTSTDYL
jgi:hypothetical protein